MRAPLFRASAVLFVFSLLCKAAAPPAHLKGDTPPLVPERERLPAPSISLPKLLNSGFYEPSKVCEDAKKAGKHLAIVAVKSHICDCEPTVQFCMHVTRVLSDPCHVYLKKHFALYHTRWSRYPDFTKGECETLPGAQKVDDAWREATKDIGSGPGIFILDVDKCKAIAKIAQGAANRSEDAAKRRLATQKLLVDALGKIQNPPAAVTTALADKAFECTGEEKKRYLSPTLRQIWDALEVQTREVR